MKALILSYASFGLVLLSSCGRKDEGKPRVYASYESCLAEEKLFIAGHCYDGNGLKGADLRTLLFSDAPLMESLQKNQIEVCFLAEDRSAGLHADMEAKVRQAVAAWTEPLAKVAPRLPKDIAFHYPDLEENKLKNRESGFASSLCPDNSDVTLVYVQDLTSFSPGKEDRGFAQVEVKEIWLSPGNSEYGVVLHEFGHLFGLADIYIEDQWNCRKDFPNSIMCQSQWDTLMPADHVAIQRSYCLLSDGASPGCFNHEPKELLSFLPQKRQSPVFPTSFRDPYMICENDQRRFSFQPYSLTLGSIGSESNDYLLPMYATDPTSIRESYSDHSFQIDISVENSAVKPIDRTPLEIHIAWQDNVFKVQFVVNDRQIDEDFQDCYIHPKLLDYFAIRNINLPKSVVSTQNYYLLTSQPSRLALHGEIEAKGLLPLYIRINSELGKILDPDSLMIFDAAHRILVKSVLIKEVGKVSRVDRNLAITLQIEKMGLEPGPYHAFIVKDDLVFEQVTFEIKK